MDTVGQKKGGGRCCKGDMKHLCAYTRGRRAAAAGNEQDNRT